MSNERDYSKLFNREHPFYKENKDGWERNHAAYCGGKDYIDLALVRHISEIPEEFSERKTRAFYFNWPRKIARIITQYVLASRPERQGADEEYVEDWSRTGLRVDEVMRQVSTMLNIFGVAWLAVDKPIIQGEKTKSDEITEKLRPYCIAIDPLSVTDWCYGQDGNLDWVIVAESFLDSPDPFSDPVRVDVRRLWDRKQVTTCIRIGGPLSDIQTVVSDHNLGRVPFVRIVEVDGFGMLDSTHWFNDVVRISDAILNNGSESQMNIVKQTFGLLVVSESFANQYDNPRTQSDSTSNGGSEIPRIISRSAAITEGEGESGISRYISPDGAQTALIREENAMLIRMMFECIGLSVSNDTKMVESAEAKLWDFQNIEQFMKTRADLLEQSEIRAWELLNLWDNRVKVPTISYNRNFAVLDLTSSVATLIELSGFNSESEDYQKEISKTAVVLLNRLRQLSQDKQETITSGIENSTPVVVATQNIDKGGQVQE